jgi:transposase
MQLRTKKQQLYFKEVIRLHQEHGYGEDRISRILPIGHSTVSRWIAIFASENSKKSLQMQKSKPQKQSLRAEPKATDVQGLQEEVARLRAQLKQEQLRADAYDEMINVAESKFNIAIRKKAGAKR